MFGAETATVRDLPPLSRQPRFHLRRSRILPGPLAPVRRQARRPGLAVYGGLVGLSLAVTLIVAPSLRETAPIAPESAPVAESPRDVSEPVRLVGATEPASPAETVTAEPSETVPPVLPPVALVANPAKQTVAPAVDLGPLPVLELDPTAFDAMQTPALDETPRPAPRGARRP